MNNIRPLLFSNCVPQLYKRELMITYILYIHSVLLRYELYSCMLVCIFMYSFAVEVPCGCLLLGNVSYSCTVSNARASRERARPCTFGTEAKQERLS